MKNLKLCEECDEEEQGQRGGSLREKIWQNQLEKFREIYLNGDIHDSVVELVVAQIQNIARHDDAYELAIKDYTREPIKLFVNTNGGELYSALAVCSAIEASKTPVHTIALGKALSAGFLILICGHERYAQLYSTLMYHTGSSGAIGVITDIQEEAEALGRLNTKIHRLIIRHTDITAEQLDEVFHRKNNWYLDVDEALELGVIDGIHGMPPPESDEIEEPDFDTLCEECVSCEEDDCSHCDLVIR